MSQKNLVNLIVFGLCVLCIFGTVHTLLFNDRVSEAQTVEKIQSNKARVALPIKGIHENNEANSTAKTQEIPLDGQIGSLPKERLRRELMPQSEGYSTSDDAENRNGPPSDPSSKSAEFVPFVPVENLTSPPIIESELRTLPQAKLIYNTTGPLPLSKAGND